MSLPRRVVAGTTYLVTRRCTQRQFLLLPSKTVESVFLYCLALASSQTGVIVHAVTVMSNHYHLIATDPRGLMPRFSYILNKFVSKCLNCHYGRWENLWAAEQASHVELASPEAVLKETLYTITNPVKDGLVPTHKEWPGLCIWRPEARTVPRPPFFFRNAGPLPASLTLELALPPLPLSVRTTEALAEAISEHESVLRADRARRRLGFLGRRRILRQRIYDTPASPEPRRDLSPRLAASNKWLRLEALRRLRDFLEDYRQAFKRWLAGERAVVFPVGTYGMRHLHGAVVAT